MLQAYSWWQSRSFMLMLVSCITTSWMVYQ